MFLRRASRIVPSVILTLCLVLGLSVPSGAPLWAADDPPVDPDLPFIIVNVASVQRLLDDAIATFESAGRPELSETIGGALDKVNDLKGLSRDQSMGLMIYLSGIVPEIVGFFPVKDLDELVKTVEVGPITSKRIGEDRIEISTPDQTFYGKVVQDYVFVASSSSAVDRPFRDPTRLTARLSRSYDIAASVNFKSIAPATRDIFLSAMRTNTENNLQRRDREPEAAYKIRRAAGMRNVEVIEQIATQGQELTIGLGLSPTEKTLSIEFVMMAAPGSEFADYFNELKGNRSRFANLLSNDTPLNASLAWQLDRSAKKMLTEIVTALEVQILKDMGEEALANAAQGTGSPSAVQNLSQSLRATIDTGKLDAVFQFVGQPGEALVLLGGMKIADGATLASGVSEILHRVKGKEAVQDVRQNVFAHKGVNVHRLDFRNVREQDERLYGGKPSLYVGVGDDVLWLAWGGDNAPAEMRRAIDKGAEPVKEAVVSAPFQLVMNFSKWMNVFDPKKSEAGFAGRARDSFSKGGDALRVEALPLDDGLRVRVTLDEAFIRLLGAQISDQIDRSEARDEEQARKSDE